MSESRTLLLVGASGFLGGHVGRFAAESGLRVVPPARGTGEAGTPGFDLLDPDAVEACVGAAQPDLVVNAAGAASVGRSWERPAETFAVNAIGALNLLEAVARRAPKAHLLCISSADVYGTHKQEELPLSEELELRPVTPYGASKAAMEMVCGQYARSRGLRLAICRAFNLLGPGQSPRFAVSGFARRIAEAEARGSDGVELGLGNPSAERDFSDVRDGARALLELSRCELEGTYNLCSGSAMTMAGLAEQLGRLARVPVTVSTDPALGRPADPPALVGDPRRLREATGFEPEIPLERTLADLLEERRRRLAGA
jgi:GDP-4-dehydro-6-deoxy-D-mannose reductase